MSSDTGTQSTKLDEESILIDNMRIESIAIGEIDDSKQNSEDIKRKDSETSEQNVENSKRKDIENVGYEDVENKNNEWVKWIEEAIAGEHIKYYDYNLFSNFREIGSGGFGKVFRVNYQNSCLVLKSFYSLNKATIKEIVHELKLHRAVQFHDNIIGFYGVTKYESENQANHLRDYMLVMEYADGGSLRNYLKKKFDELTWDDKFSLGYQVSSAVSCLHTEGIVHRDLHSGNILIHDNKIKLSDFGLSRRMNEVSKSQSKLFGIVPYVDPTKFDKSSYGKKNKYNPTQVHLLDKKSDIYSVGVLLWEISSGRTPFLTRDNDNFDVSLAVQISQGLREKPVLGTPNDYVKLYTKCWDKNPDVRPNINQVVDSLGSMINKTDLVDYYEEQEPSDPVSSAPITSSSVQGDLSYMIKNFDNMDSKDFEKLETENLMQNAKEILKFVTEITNKGNEPKLRRNEVLSYINKNSINSKQVYNWLSNNQDDPGSVFLLGYFNSLGIETVKDYEKAYELYVNPSVQDYPLTSYYIGLCYLHGYGIGKDEKKAYECFEKSANKDCAAGQISVGYCYFMGTGVKKDLKMAVHWYEKAANNGNIMAMYNLGLLYLNGNGVNKDVKKAFELFKDSAEGGYSGGISMLGYCYDTAIGTSIDKQKAFEQYERAAKLDNNVAQYNLARKYKKGEGVEKNTDKAIHWYKKSAEYGNPKAKNKLDKLDKLGKRSDSCKIN